MGHYPLRGDIGTDTTALSLEEPSLGSQHRVFQACLLKDPILSSLLLKHHNCLGIITCLGREAAAEPCKHLDSPFVSALVAGIDCQPHSSRPETQPGFYSLNETCLHSATPLCCSPGGIG